MKGRKIDKINYFEGFDDQILIEMALFYPDSLRKMCTLISLDIQIEKESYGKYKNSSNRRSVC